MDYKTIILDKNKGIATITLNRPDRLNALSSEMSREIWHAIEETESDTSSRVLVLTGTGRAFCAGEDVKERPGDSAEVRQRQTPLTKLSGGPKGLMKYADTFRNMVKPTIAAVNGFAVGQGLSLAMSCDIRIASEDARFGAIWVRRGIPPESAGAYLLTQLVGPAKACELVFTGKMLSAGEAKDIGLVNEVVPADQLQEATREMARSIAEGPPIAIGTAKMMIYQALETSLAVSSRLEFFGQDYSFNTEDREEGIRSFLEKRPPEFKGK
ncbi:MAG TPA: enoyl-CoA hydratase/isomerase family protein [Dehalococcoidia bacterium]|nr:enoyl-CoA hydratase/isomerase family protein [Dehalococcoidia bacterium]